ncbi:MAG: hypothetical protein JWN66_3439 [Sphingomonas bacterium]|jgi:hypothetical protein|nr:hypothetical protein [Sphingomonas bacterium]
MHSGAALPRLIAGMAPEPGNVSILGCIQGGGGVELMNEARTHGHGVGADTAANRSMASLAAGSGGA